MSLVRRQKGVTPLSPKTPSSEPGTQPLLAPSAAWRILCRATGGGIGRSTFYRWLRTGKVYSIRLGFRIFIPWPALDDVIKQCKAGERL